MNMAKLKRINLLKIMLVAATALLAACLLALADTEKSAKAAFPGQNGKIVFQRAASNSDTNTEIYAMDPDGANQTNLTNNPAPEFDPTVSADGTKIAFESGRDGNMEIYVMNADGTNQTRLTNAPGSDSAPAWSADGTKIAFHRSSGGGAADQIYVMNADGSGQTQLTSTTEANVYPAWSPDGTKIAFASYRDGNAEIYVMNADGTDQSRLTNNPGLDYLPDWSPDGDKIAFYSDQAGHIGNDEIYVMNADGTNQTRLTNDPFSDFAPAWSPDGTKIAFVSTRASTTTIANGDIYVMNANGSGQTSVTSGSENDNLPSWQPLPLPPTAYDFSGFFSPVDNPDVATNKAKAGSAIPVKFSLGGDFGLDIFADGYPKFQQSACDSSDPSDAIEQTLSDASSHLNYDATTDQYTYVWKTNKDWAKNKTCGTLIVKLADDTEHLANFEFTK
jgi:Tol biopolymer transport system component